MSPRSILAFVASGVIAVAIGGAAIVGAAASGAPSVPDVPAAVPAAAVPDKPAPVLHLPSTLHLITHTTGAVRLTASRQVYSNAITKPGSRTIIGIEALTCLGELSSPPRETCTGALALRDGVLTINETLDISTAKITGTIVGGTSSYRDAQGEVSGEDQGGGVAKLTLNYSVG